MLWRTEKNDLKKETTKTIPKKTIKRNNKQRNEKSELQMHLRKFLCVTISMNETKWTW